MATRRTSCLYRRTSALHAREQFSGYCQRFARGTRDNYARVIAALYEYCRPATLADLRYPEIAAYINSRLACCKNQSVNNDIIAIRAFGRWIEQTYELPNPAAKLRKLAPEDPESRFLSQGEYDAVRRVSEGRDLALIRFLAHTGLRAAELIALRPCDLQGSWLTVRGKGRKRRLIPLNTVALETVSVAIEFTKSGHALLEICYSAAKRAGIARFGPHALRHYHATQLLARGTPIHHVSRLLGHSSVAVTEQIYYHFMPEYLSGLTDCLVE